MKGKQYLAVLLVAAVLALGVFFIYGASAEPIGVKTFNATWSERANVSEPGEHDAQAGNITELMITALVTTSSWQGYVGNISGAIQLADSSGGVLYNWSLVSPSGEIYASVNETIAWTNIQCFNFTAVGNFSTGGETPGGTSLYGMNLTQLEAAFGIKSGDADGVDETFSLTNNHAGFYTAGRQFSVGECVSADLFDSTGASVDGNFEQVILYEPTTTSVIFTALLENDLAGYNNRNYDFQMLVLEDGHGDGASSTTKYYFFVELE